MNRFDGALSHLSTCLTTAALCIYMVSSGGPSSVVALLEVATIGYFVLFLRALRP